MTLTLQNIESLKHALETVNKFCIHAGSKVNISKIECIVLGPFKSMFTDIEGITVTNKSVKCLGIHVGHDKIECYNKNWMKIYHDIDTLFESWKRRKLTLFGKCTVINSLALSKLIYVASILEIPDEDYIKRINKLIYNFIWNKTDRIKRNTLIGHVKEGGLGITDVDSKIKALKASWVPRLKETKHCIKSYVNSYCSPINIDMDYLINTTENKIENYEIIKTMPLFYKQAFTCFNTCKDLQNKLSPETFLKQPIWSNLMFLYKGKTIFFKTWLKSNILFVKDLYSEAGTLKSPEEIANVLINKNNWLCEYKIIKTIFKNYENKFDLRVCRYMKQVQVFTPSYNKYSTKDFYNQFIKKKFQIPSMQSKYNKEFDIFKSDWENIYMNKIVLLQDKKISEFNYKLLNNLLSNNYFVSKIN